MCGHSVSAVVQFPYTLCTSPCQKSGKSSASHRRCASSGRSGVSGFSQARGRCSPGTFAVCHRATSLSRMHLHAEHCSTQFAVCIIGRDRGLISDSVPQSSKTCCWPVYVPLCWLVRGYRICQQRVRLVLITLSSCFTLHDVLAMRPLHDILGADSYEGCNGYARGEIINIHTQEDRKPFIDRVTRRLSGHH